MLHVFNSHSDRQTTGRAVRRSNRTLLSALKHRKTTWNPICRYILWSYDLYLYVYAQTWLLYLLEEWVCTSCSPSQADFLASVGFKSSTRSASTMLELKHCCTMLLLLHICRPCCPTLCADVVFTCLVKWWGGKAQGNSKYHIGMLASICGQGYCGSVLHVSDSVVLSVKYSIEVAILYLMVIILTNVSKWRWFNNCVELWKAVVHLFLSVSDCQLTGLRHITGQMMWTTNCCGVWCTDMDFQADINVQKYMILCSFVRVSVQLEEQKVRLVKYACF